MSFGAGWYASNQSRSYPLHAIATTVADDGQFLPEDLIVDLKLRFPGDSEATARISHAVSGPNISVVISSGDNVIATATAARGVSRAFTQVPLVPSVDGAEGYVVFGPTVAHGSWTFSSDQQSRLSRQAAMAQPNLNTLSRLSRRGSVPGIGPETYLSGLGDITLQRVQRELGGSMRSAIAIGLLATAERNALALYSGPCGQRPEAGTCDDPTPIESIDQVRPDCCGRIFVEFRGCAEILPIANRCGIVVRCDITTEQICRDPVEKLPDEEGNIPNQGEDTCDDPDSPPSSNSQAFG